MTTLTNDDLRERLCKRDTRNPKYDQWASHVTSPCHACPSCYSGAHPLADELLRLREAALKAVVGLELLALLDVDPVVLANELRAALADHPATRPDCHFDLPDGPEYVATEVPPTSDPIPDGCDEKYARSYIKDWCPDHVKDYVTRLVAATEAPPERFTMREIVQGLTQHYIDSTGDARHVPATIMAEETAAAIVRIIQAQRAERGEAPPERDAGPDYKCRNGDKYQCPNMKGDPKDTSMESEQYECAVCGCRYKLYYEDMT